MSFSRGFYSSEITVFDLCEHFGFRWCYSLAFNLELLPLWCSGIMRAQLWSSHCTIELLAETYTGPCVCEHGEAGPVKTAQLECKPLIQLFPH